MADSHDALVPLPAVLEIAQFQQGPRLADTIDFSPGEQLGRLAGRKHI